MANTDEITENKHFDREFVAYSFEVINRILAKEVFTEERILDGNGIVLPATAMEQLVQFHVSSPYAFRLRSKLGMETYVSVHNFAGQDKAVYLPRWIMEKLHVDDGDRLTVQSVDLPKVSKVGLKASEDFLKTTDPRCVVEMKLRGTQVICIDQQIRFTHAKRKYQLTVEKLEPAIAGSIVDADLTLEFITD